MLLLQIDGITNPMIVGETGATEIDGMIRDGMTVIGSLKTAARNDKTVETGMMLGIRQEETT